MERRKHEEIEVSTAHQTTGTLALKNFTIPRKKRTSGQVVLERCPEESRDYALIQSKLRDSRLDTSKDQVNTWIWKDVHLVYNDELLRRFSEKRAEMRAKGRHGRETEERFCFLVASDQDMPHMYQDGLKVGSSVQHALGKPSHGVYLFRHVDVAVKSTTSASATHLLIFKVLYGKVKKIAPNVTLKKSQDPVVSFDCYMSKDVVSPRDTSLQQVIGSSVFLFDFNENQELNERPRQCLPYAVVSYAPASSVILTTSLNLPFSPTSHDAADRFQACTVAQRKGKGDTATITFKHFGTTQNPGVDYLFQKADVQSISINHNSMLHHTIFSQNLLREEANHKRNTSGTREIWDKCDTTPQSPIDKVSTIVYSSRSVRDPRLSRRNANHQSKERSCTASRNEDGPQNEDANSGFVAATSESSSKEPSNNECSLRCSLNICVHALKQKAETLPSIKLFKMKFQKYATYFRLNEEERHNKIWSLENMSPEQKHILLDRIQFYEVYYQKYKKGLLYQNANGVETEKTTSLSLKQSQENHMTLSQSHVSQTTNNKANHSSETTCFVDSNKCSRNTDKTYMNQSQHQHDPEHCAGMLPENKQDQEYVQHLNGSLVSKPFLEVGSLNLNLMNENIYLKEPAPSSCSFRETSNPNIKHQSEPSTGTGEDAGNESCPVELFEKPGHESVNMFADNITAMDIASSVVVSSCGMSENSYPNSATAERREQDGQNNRSSFSQDSILPELNMATLQVNSSTHIGLYQRLQLDELFPSQNGEQIVTSRAYLSPRVTPTDTKNQSKTEPLGIRCWKNPHLIITLKANNTPYHTERPIALSERFSKLKSCKKKAFALVKEYNETGSSNVKLMKLLAKRYNMTKLHAKCRSLKKPQTSALALGRSLKTKYVKKHFWNVKKIICTNVVSAESSREAAHRTATSDNPSHTSKIDLKESTDLEPDPTLRKMSHTSDAVCDEQQLYIQVSQEANAITNLYKTSPINNIIPSPGFKTSSETKEEETKPAEPLLADSFCTDTNKPTDDVTVNPIPVIANEVEQVKDMLNENKTFLNNPDSNEDISQDHESTFTEEKSVLQEVTSHMTSDPLCRVELNSEELSEDVKASENFSSFNPLTFLTLESKVMCDSEVDYIETSEINIQNENRSSTNAKSGAWAIDTATNGQVEVLMEEGLSELQHCTKQARKSTKNNLADLTNENSSSSDQCEMASEHPNSINTSLLDVKVSDTKHASAAIIMENCKFSRPEQNQNCDVDSPETQLISKLRDYLTKFESSVKKQEALNEGLREKPLMWITLDSTAHKQQLAEKGQYSCRPNDEAQTGPDVYLLLPAESKRGRSSQAKRTSRHKSKRARWSSCPSVSPDSTSALETVEETSPQPSVTNGTAAPTEISLSNEAKPQFLMQSKDSISSIICSQDPVDTSGNGECKPHTNREIVHDGDVSSSLVSNDFSVSDILNTLKMADQTSSLSELGSLRSKCKNMLQQFILRFEQDQIISFNQSFVSRNLIVEQYLDHPPPHVDLKYEAVNSYLELQMMMEAWQFVENKMNFLRGKPTFRSLLWYDPSLYGELYKGEVGFQQQSSLFTSFQKMLGQEGYAKLHEYYMTHVSRMYQQLLVNPDVSYYMYLKSKREVFEIEAALRNPHDVKYFFLSVPLTTMINFGDSLESLENVHKVIMTFVETPSDQLQGKFDVGKAEHLSITCRYLQEKAFFIRSCKETPTKVSWFGIEHLLYDASKILIWQDVGQGVSNEVLKMYKNSNPQIIFGVTESGVTLVNKVQQPCLSMDRAVTSAEKQTDASQKHKTSQSSVLQTVNYGMEADYSLSKRRETHPGIAPHTNNDNGANPLYQTPSARAGNSTPYHTPHQHTSVNWGMMNRSVLNTWNAPSTSHVQSEIKSFLSRRRVSSSHADQRTSLPDVRRVQAVREQKWPLMLAAQTTLQADSFVSRKRFQSVKHQQTSTPSHCPVPSKEQANRSSLAMAQPFSLPNFPLNANFVAPHSLPCVPLPNTIPGISYPYFLLNGQTYTTDSTAAVNPYTRFYHNTV